MTLPTPSSQLRARCDLGYQAEVLFKEWAAGGAKHLRSVPDVTLPLTASKKGWPDFIATTAEGEVICIEVKCSYNSALSPHQVRVMKLLSKAGLRCFRWCPDVGLIPWTENGPVRRKRNVLDSHSANVPASRRRMADAVMAERARLRR